MQRGKRNRYSLLGFLISLIAAPPLLLLSNLSHAQQQANLAFSQNARTFETKQGTLVTKTMAFACLSLKEVPDGLPCNPAFTPVRKDSTFGVEGLLSNGYSTLEMMRELLAGNVNQDLVNALFSGNNVLQIEGNFEVDFLSPYFNAKYTPFTVKYFSVVRNEANPFVDLYAVQEDNLVMQSGYEILPNLYAGLQVRSVERKYIDSEFQLLDLLTDQGKNDLQPNTQRALYFEPGLAYVLDLPWHPTIAAMLANAGIRSGDFTDLSEPTEAQYSAGIAPPLPWGDLNIEVDYRSMSNLETSPSQRLSLGVLYHFGVMYLGGGLDYNGVSGGLYYSLKEMNAGILYSSTRVPWQNADYYAQTVYVELGWRL